MQKQKKNKSMTLLKEKQEVYEINKKVISLSVIEEIVEEVVNKKLRELLSDPDYGLELREEFKNKLDSILRQKKKIIPEEEIAEKYGVKL
ncbi:MAG: hypothetical protein AB1393_09375 [Candidatus Edwardsbacteria bacterium]